ASYTNPNQSPGTNIGSTHFLSGTIRFDTPPVLNDGLIGGWAMLGNMFASYDADLGVQPLAGALASINSATATSNVDLVSPAVLGTSKTINSLRIENQANLNLGTNTLTI